MRSKKLREIGGCKIEVSFVMPKQLASPYWISEPIYRNISKDLVVQEFYFDIIYSHSSNFRVTIRYDSVRVTTFEFNVNG